MKNKNDKSENENIIAKSENERNDTLLIYRSRKGSTLEYAEWISDELDCDVIPYTRGNLGYSVAYKNIIIGGWIRGGEIAGMSLLRQNSSNFHLHEKKIILFGVGVADPTVEYMEKMRKINCEGGFKYASLYFLPGRHKISNRGISDRMILKLAGSTMYESLPEDQIDTLKARLNSDYDGMDRKYIKPIVDEILATRK